MTKSPPARRGSRARRGTDAGPEQWLELPGWRKPLDALLALAVTFSAAWLGLVVIPAAANGSDTTIADEPVDASGPTAEPTPDLSQWMAGPTYTGGPAVPTTALATTAEVVAAVDTQPPPAPRAAPRRTSSRAVPRTTAPRTTAAPVAPAVAAATTAALPTTETPATSAVLTTSETATTTATETTTTETSSETTTTETPTTTTAPATTTPPSGG